MIELTKAQKNSLIFVRQEYIHNKRIYFNLDTFNSLELHFGNLTQLCSLIEHLKDNPKTYKKTFSKKGLQKYSQHIKVLENLIKKHIKYEIIYSDTNDTLVKITKLKGELL